MSVPSTIYTYLIHKKCKFCEQVTEHTKEKTLKTNKMSRPNIFNYATSELSQDAFICWFIAWADKRYKSTDNRVNKIAIQFVLELLEKDNSYTIETIEVGRQWNNIDVWALVNGQYFIVIEDKKGSKEHSDQLNRYAEIAKNHFNNQSIKLKLVYFKMEEQGNYTNVEKSGFSVFGRSKMLKVLEPYFNHSDKKNDIISDYYENLNELDKKIKSFKTLPIKDWHWFSWQGFYSELQKQLKGEWNYVANAAGGFLGFWWHWKYGNIENKEFDFYLQLEQHKFIFKLYTYKPTERNEVRNIYREYLYQKANELKIPIKQFGRIGQWMGVAILVNEYRICDENGILNFTNTLENLKRSMNLLDEVEKEIKAHNNV